MSAARDDAAAPVFEAEFVAGLTTLFEERIPFNHVLGLRIDSLAADGVAGHLAMRPDLIGHYAHQRLHGGVISATLDAMIDRYDAGPLDGEGVAQLCLLKNHATQTMQFCADQAVQILGAMGFMRGTKSERIYREVKVMMIGGGSEEIMKELAARQLGL